MKNFINNLLSLRGLLTAAACVLGCLSDLNRIDVPYWVFIVILVVYWLLDLTGNSNKRITSIGGGALPDPDGKVKK